MKTSDLRSSFQNPYAAQTLLTRWALFALALGVAGTMAYWIGRERFGWLFLMLAATVLTLVVVGLRHRAWILIVIGWSFMGGTALLRLPLSIRDMSVLLATGAYITYRILSHRHERYRPHPLDWLVAVNLAYLVFTYIHNPVGFRAVGSEKIGGRPYLNIFIATLAYWVMIRLPESPRPVSKIPHFLLVGATLITLLNVLVYVKPSLTPIVSWLYSSIDLDVYVLAGSSGTRYKGLSHVGEALAVFLCALYAPRTLYNPLRPRFYAMLLALGCILASGYRNSLMWAIAAIALGSWLHRGWREMAAGVLAGAFLLGFIVLGQGRFYELPHAAQRTLSFIPGKWSPVAVSDAEASTEVRVEWWRDVVKYRLISDWWWGDGFGIQASDYQTLGRRGRFTEDVILTGSFHSGPLTAIRNAGLVGLGLFYILMIAAAVYSYRCVQQCRGTLLFPVAVFVAIQLIWQPFHYTFIFGSYDSAVPQQLFRIAILVLLFRMAARLRAQPVLAESAPRASLERPLVSSA